MKTKSYLSALIICFLFVLVTGISLSHAGEDIFSDLKVGDRVAITLKNHRVFKGEIKVLISNRITIDISYDNPDLKGRISFCREDIKRIRILTPLSQAEKKKELTRKRKELTKYRKEALKDEPVLPAIKKEETASSVPKQSEEEKERERLLELLNRFPVEAGWDKERRTAILDKNPIFRTAEEKEFLKIYDDWTKAVELKGQIDRQALLEKFSPEKGWDEEKHQELSTRFVRIGTVLNAEEREFVDKFKDWKKALAERKAKEAAARKAEEEQPALPSQPEETKQ